MAELEQRLKEQAYDLVLTDLNLLKRAGLQVLDAVRSCDPELPVVLVTEAGSEDLAAEAMKRGVADYVLKTPQHLQRLPHTIRAIMERQRLHRECEQAEARLKARIRQQAVVVELGQRALAGTALDTLLQETTVLVAQTLGLELCHVLEFRHGGKALFLRAGVGWAPGLVGHTTVRLSAGAEACFPLASTEPVFIEHLPSLPASGIPPLLRQHDVVSGMNVLIPAATEPYGILGVYSREPGSFSRDDLHFLQAVANVLTTAIDRKRAEERLRTSEERYRTLVESARDVIYTVSKEGRITSLNPAFETYTGFPVEAWIDRPFFELVHPDDLSLAREAFERILHGERPDPYELRIRTRSGSYLVAELTTQPDLQNGRLVGSFGIARDVSDRKRFEAELIAAKEKAEEMNRLKTAFLTNMSHEIRTPLTAIIGFSSILAAEVDEAHQEFVHLIEQSGQRLLHTLNAVLDLAMLESGTLKLDLRPLNVIEEVAEVLTAHEPAARRKGLRLTLQADTGELIAELDRACLGRILNNLIDNAVKFTEQGEVIVGLDAREGRLEIRIQDTGIGIHPSFIPHLFEAFKQENMGIDRPFEGTGLGLAITQKLVTLLQGEIRVESTKGKGSTFVVSFPTATPAPQPGEAVPPESAPDRQASVLAIEDNPDMHVLIRRFLGPQYDVVTAEDEERALARARERVFDIVLMDINLGRARTGVEVLQELRRVPGYTDVPVIAVTAYALPGDREHFLRSGFDGYLSKPFNKRVLEETILQVLAA
ncbi:MAG: hypothetical protein KatS3mg043_1748 [Rhodothermaceae bacterium]|nr:MAG: hypothetical protein KatS3mg043_1748 [Rhodothermaceae bacterium]